MQTRIATSNDVDSVVRIIRTSRDACLPYAKSPHSSDSFQWWVGNKLIPAHQVIVAQIADDDVGIVATSQADGVGWIDQLYIAPGHLRQGIGTALLTEALTALPRPIHLWTFQQNTSAIKFYKHHGFTAIEFTNGENNEEKCPDILFELK